MGQRGPAPTPTKVLELRGSWRANLPKDEPQPESKLGKMPAGLPPRAKTEWKRCKEWMGGEVMKDCDRSLVETYCRLVAEIDELQKVVKKEGHIQVADNGYMSQHPAAIMLHKSRDMLVKLTDRLGLNPSSRSRISVKPAEPKRSPYEEFKRGGKA